jgi:hypothetical protein
MVTYIRLAPKLYNSSEFIRKGSVIRNFGSFQESTSSVVREFSVQMWSINQRTTEAEEVTDS